MHNILRNTLTHIFLRSHTRMLLLLGALLTTSELHAGEYEQRNDVQVFAEEMQTRYGFKKDDVLQVLSHER